jgi:integrase
MLYIGRYNPLYIHLVLVSGKAVGSQTLRGRSRVPTGPVSLKITQRNGHLYLYKRVPKRYEAVEPRMFVWVSLYTDSMSVASTKAATAWDLMIEGWEAKLAGDTSDAETRFAAARELAAVRGFRYLDAAAVARLPRDDLLDRVEAVGESSKGPDFREAAALLGGARQPEITISRALDLYWALAADRVIGKSDDQLRRWKNPLIKAIRNLIAVIGDKPMSQITGDDMLDCRQWWMDKLASEGLTANSANKDLVHVGSVLKTVNKMKRLGLVLPLGDLSLKQGQPQVRPPFSDAWIREKLMAPGRLAGLNSEARCIILGMVNTGYRPSEGAALLPGHIRLDHNVPHISIEAEGRQLKSANAKRIIPLTGISLAALREFPSGFPRYRDNPSLSDTVSKFLTENGLMETPRHTLYSLRHAFEDRMLAARFDERIRRDLLGHSLDRERYGKGASLEHMRELIQAIAL